MYLRAAVILVLAVGWLGFLFLALKEGYFTKILEKLGFKEPTAKFNWTAFSWESCLEKLELQVDAAFIGDSLVRGGDFQKAFPDKKIINLGSSGDTVAGMINRAGMLKTVSAKQVFLMAGINGLTDHNVSCSAKKYAKLLDTIGNTVPDAAVYVLSVLPIAKSKERSICKNSKIRKYNQAIKQAASERDITYIDLYALYEKNGEMDRACTKDGLHLYPQAYNLWFDAIRKYIR